MSDERSGVTLELSADEALVLFDWLARTSDADHPVAFDDHAEKVVLWNLECQLEEVLVEPFSENYRALVHAARAALYYERPQ
jgi:hypothetical protein